MNCSMQSPLDPCLLDYTNEQVISIGYFDYEELAIFSRLINNRRALPVYLGDCWRCYDCIFESSDLEIMANHIMKAHKPAPQVND